VFLPRIDRIMWKAGPLDSFASARIEGLFRSSIPLSSVLDELIVGVMLLDLEKRIMFMNQSMGVLTGYSREEVQGLPCCDVLRSNFCNLQCPATETRDNETRALRTGNIINRQREKIPVRMSTSLLKDTAGEVVGFLEMVEDLRAYQELGKTLQDTSGFGNILGRSQKMEEIFQVLPVIVQTDSAVLITGETGTGKDVVAEAIHQASARAGESFIKVNCGALPETLLESELFGHKKGAFTGAVSDKPGRLTLAHQGTLFLTEIGDLPLTLQVKLLTFLDDQVVYPLGSPRGIQADVRIIAATHRDLERMVKEGQFREDLLFRLKVMQLHLPPLRERAEDIGLLTDHFLAGFSSRFGKRIQGVSEQVRQKMLSYSYPGNVRELRNIIEFAVNICQGEEILPDHLPAYLFTSESNDREKPESVPPVVARARAAGQGGDPGVNWPALERQLIVDALIQAKGRRNQAARILGWGRSTLWRKMKQYGLEA